MIYPISYSCPEELIVPYVPFKTCHTAKHDYQFQSAQPYLENYRKSIFGTTSLKCGWDCFRHYEILSQGTIPFFENLQKCPAKTLHNFPKTEVLRLMEKYGPLTFEEIMKTNSSELYDDINGLLTYTRQNLTTRKSAEYILSKIPTPNTDKVLLLHNTGQKPDYLCEMIAHGLKRHTDGAADIFPERDYLYHSYPVEETAKLYGKGFNYTRHLPGSYRKNLDTDTVNQRIAERYYDHIFIYVMCTHDYPIPFLNGGKNLFSFYTPQEVSFLCGRDCDPYWSPELNWYIRMNHTCSLEKFTQPHGMNLFIREFGEGVAGP